MRKTSSSSTWHSCSFPKASVKTLSHHVSLPGCAGSSHSGWADVGSRTGSTGTKRKGYLAFCFLFPVFLKQEERTAVKPRRSGSAGSMPTWPHKTFQRQNWFPFSLGVTANLAEALQTWKFVSDSLCCEGGGFVPGKKSLMCISTMLYTSPGDR